MKFLWGGQPTPVRVSDLEVSIHGEPPASLSCDRPKLPVRLPNFSKEVILLRYPMLTSGQVVPKLEKVQRAAPSLVPLFVVSPQDKREIAGLYTLF